MLKRSAWINKCSALSPSRFGYFDMRIYRDSIIRRFHPEGIPWPGSVLYNAISNTKIFHEHYDLVAHDVARLGASGFILDIGTGPGHLLLAMQKLLPEAILVGVDTSAAMVAQAKKNLEKVRPNPLITVNVANARALPFGDETFHCIVSTGSLHHWKDPIQSLGEAYRILKPGGFALIYDLVRNMPKALCQEIRAHFGSFRLVLLWLHSFEEPFLDADEMETLGRNTEFAVEGTKFTGALCCLVMKKGAEHPHGKGQTLGQQPKGS